MAPPIPQEAIAYLENKSIQPSFHYQDVWLQEHSQAFTIAKMMDADLLSDIRDSITEAMKQGQTYKQWSNQVTEVLQKNGWWGKKALADTKTGGKVEAQLGSPRRLKTIFDVNTGQAYQRGVWERGYQSDAHPYILYRVGPSKEHRPQHLAWDGLVLLKDDPFWKTHNPRNGWGCKCKSRFVSRTKFRQLQKNGLPDMTSMVDGKPTKTITIKTERPELKRMTYLNKRTGETHEGYEGIDPGFEHNPGIENTL